MNETKMHIVLIASKLFLQKSFKEVTMNEIVKETGLSKGAFYHYFTSKEQLFLEVLEDFFKRVSRNYENYSKESLYRFYNDYIDDTIRLSKKYMENFDKNSGNELTESSITINYFSLIFDALKLFPGFRDKVVDGFNTEINYWTKAIEQARKKGEIKAKMSDKEIAEIFMYLSDGVGMHMIFRGADIENMVKPFQNLWNKFYNQIKT